MFEDTLHPSVKTHPTTYKTHPHPPVSDPPSPAIKWSLSLQFITFLYYGQCDMSKILILKIYLYFSNLKYIPNINLKTKNVPVNYELTQGIKT